MAIIRNQRIVVELTFNLTSPFSPGLSSAGQFFVTPQITISHSRRRLGACIFEIENALCTSMRRTLHRDARGSASRGSHGRVILDTTVHFLAMHSGLRGRGFSPRFGWEKPVHSSEFGCWSTLLSFTATASIPRLPANTATGIRQEHWCITRNEWAFIMH